MGKALMSKLRTYTRISLLDLFRLWRSTQHHVVIVAGICLPLFLLLGIKSGFIEELREELLASPQGRQVTFWAMEIDQYLKAGNIDEIKSTNPEIDIVIPDVQRLIQLSTMESQEIFDVTLVPTVPDDPLLSFANIAIPSEGKREIILTKSLAEKMGVNSGDTLKFHLARKTDAGRETGIVPDILVKAIYDLGDTASDTGYCDINLIDDIELYIQGFAAKSLGLSAAEIQFSPKSSGYLLVSRTDLAADDDLLPLKDFGFRVTALGNLTDGFDPSDSNIPIQTLMLYRRVLFEESNNLVFYYLDGGNPNMKFGFSPAQLAAKTRADDVVIVVSKPITAKSNNDGTLHFLGFDLSRSTWLRNFVRRPGLPFRFPMDINNYRICETANSESLKTIRLQLSNSDVLFLNYSLDDSLERFPNKASTSKKTIRELRQSEEEVNKQVENLSEELSKVKAKRSTIEKKIAETQMVLSELTDDDEEQKSPRQQLEEFNLQLKTLKEVEQELSTEIETKQTIIQKVREELTSGLKIRDKAPNFKLRDFDFTAIKTEEIPILETEPEQPIPEEKTPSFLPEPSNELKIDSVEQKASDKHLNTSEQTPAIESSSPVVPLSSQNVTSDTSVDTSDELIRHIMVPTRLLGCIREYRKQNIEFDMLQQIFIERSPVLTYGRARVYCKTIDDVPNVVNSLSDSGYAVLSEKGRIDEIHATNDSLQLLVLIVGIGVIGFGILTVFSVLSDSTDRKRGTIGVLRVMGVSRIGVFYVVVFRASLIGVAAGVFSIFAGLGIATALQAKIYISFEPSHMVVVVLGALFCSGAGALLPALKASRLDPFDAIQEGKFH
jgi:ABC-type lipoprotein release transport system permease subunit